VSFLEISEIQPKECWGVIYPPPVAGIRVKTVAELRNIGDAAYVMSHAAAEARTVHTAAGCRAWH